MTLNTSHLRAVYCVCITTPHHTKFEMPSFTHSKDMIGAQFFLKWVT